MNKRAPEKMRFAALATDVVLCTVLDEKLKVLLMQIDLPPHYKNTWALPGSLIRPNETAIDTAKRLLADKAKIDPKHAYLEQLYTFSRIDRDPRNRVVSVAYLGLIPGSRAAIYERSWPKNMKWCDIEKIPSLAYDHTDMARTAVERLKSKIAYTNIAFGMMPEQFTLTELQELYEAILNKELDKRNFRRKVIDIGLIETVKNKITGVAHRPALLYRFKSKKSQIIDVL
ncbi:MAG: NUDIX domain-containing protein [Candidatus Azambacteria bacterium]|nr:NUDIX domain-containing protein [Candidatus Azambacteria bacterium]